MYKVYVITCDKERLTLYSSFPLIRRPPTHYATQLSFIIYYWAMMEPMLLVGIACTAHFPAIHHTLLGDDSIFVYSHWESLTLGSSNKVVAISAVHRVTGRVIK